MIDLHTHSNESDGSWSPERLVDESVKIGLDALAIADHDTLAGYDRALEHARARNLDLVCAVEVGTTLTRPHQPPLRHVHVLAYFLGTPPTQEFRNWLAGICEGRRDRNRRLAERLQALGLCIFLEEVEALGRSITGRPHFAKVLVAKGYAVDSPDAFQKFLGNSAKAYVPRRGPSTSETIRQIRAAGGLPVLAHPSRLTRERPESLEGIVQELAGLGLGGIEAYHSDHTPADTHRLLGLAQAFGLAVTGGSDYHGEAKPGVELGKLEVPNEILHKLRWAIGG